MLLLYTLLFHGSASYYLAGKIPKICKSCCHILHFEELRLEHPDRNWFITKNPKFFCLCRGLCSIPCATHQKFHTIDIYYECILIVYYKHAWPVHYFGFMVLCMKILSRVTNMFALMEAEKMKNEIFDFRRKSEPHTHRQLGVKI
jgi:hypothetical protein